MQIIKDRPFSQENQSMDHQVDAKRGNNLTLPRCDLFPSSGMFLPWILWNYFPKFIMISLSTSTKHVDLWVFNHGKSMKRSCIVFFSLQSSKKPGKQRKNQPKKPAKKCVILQARLVNISLTTWWLIPLTYLAWHLVHPWKYVVKTG